MISDINLIKKLEPEIGAKKRFGRMLRDEERTWMPLMIESPRKRRLRGFQ